MTYRGGDHYALCDECGFKKRRSELKRRWDNALVCREDWEPRHPQDFVRATQDKIRVSDPRSEGEDQFISTAVRPEDL